MPKDLAESVSGSTELVFPDDADGETYRLRERSVYDAEEVRDEIEAEIPEYGSWLPVELNGDEAFLSAPSQLRAILVEDEIRPGEAFRVETVRKTGRDQSDPYKVQVSFPEREAGEPAQSGLEV